MALIAAVSTELLEFATNIGLLSDEDNVGAVRRAVERLKAVCADFADYTSAINGQLVLSQKPVNIRRLLSRIATPSHHRCTRGARGSRTHRGR